MRRGPMCSVSHSIRTSDGSFHAPAISGSGTRRPANAYGYLRGTGTQFDPSLGVTISAIFYRPPTTALYGFGNRRRVAVLKWLEVTTSVLSTQSGPSIADLLFPAILAGDCLRSPLMRHPIPVQFEPKSSTVAWRLPKRPPQPVESSGD